MRVARAPCGTPWRHSEAAGHEDDSLAVLRSRSDSGGNRGLKPTILSNPHSVGKGCGHPFFVVGAA